MLTSYYENYNEKRIDKVLELFDEQVEYQDLIYQDSFKGKEELAAYFKKIGALVPSDIRFVVDDITEGDENKCGVLWHVEIESEREGMVELPFSRGVSFYRLNDQGRIIFARDIVESPFKPGESSLGGITAVAPLIRKLGTRANPSNISTPDDGKNLLQAGLMLAFATGYIGIVLLSDLPPGSPAYMTDPKDLERILHESYNFFYVNMFMGDWFGLNIVPNIAENPVDEGIFNFINAWSLMFLPLWIDDPKGQPIPFWRKRFPLWLGTMFLTNVFLPFYMAIRLIPDIYLEDNDKKNEEEVPDALQTGQGGRIAIGILSTTVALVSIAWIVVGRPEYSATDRLDFFMTSFSSNRVFWAFCLDAVLYSVWQFWILTDLKAPIYQRVTPLFGMAVWLLGTQNKSIK